MPCYNLIDAWQTADGSVVFHEHGDIVRSLSIPCGQCIGCRLERSRQWAVRCTHEASLYDYNCFLTLTYNNDNVPHGGNLRYTDFQLFMKRLRKQFPQKIRFYMVGEYGEKLSRPHYHACVFNFDLPDKLYHAKSDSGSKLYTSAILSKLWPHGHATTQNFTYETAAYAARYCVDKITGDKANAHYLNLDAPDPDGVLIQRTPEFNRMSLKPGIGRGWYEKFSSDVFPHDHVIIDGTEQSPPKYYSRLYAKSHPLKFEEIQFKRYTKSVPLMADNTPERQAVKAAVAKARLALSKRNSNFKD